MTQIRSARSIASHPEEFRYLILALQRQGSRQLNSLFAQIGLTNSQAEAAEIIGEYGPMSTKEVGQYLVCESGSPSRLLAALASKGLTVASQSSQDRRSTLHALSPQGRAALQQVLQLKVEFEAQLADSLGEAEAANPEDIMGQLCSLLQDVDLKAAMKRRYPHLFNE